MLTSINSKANANANKNNIILMFRSQKAQNKKEIWPHTFIFEDCNSNTKNYQPQTNIYYERETDYAIVKVTEVMTIPSCEDIDTHVKRHISESFYNDLEYLGIARRYVPNFEIDKGINF